MPGGPGGPLTGPELGAYKVKKRNIHSHNNKILLKNYMAHKNY